MNLHLNTGRPQIDVSIVVISPLLCPTAQQLIAELFNNVQEVYDTPRLRQVSKNLKDRYTYMLALIF